MSALLYLIPISILLGAIALVAFLWTLKNGQYDDLEGAAVRILTDEDKPLPRDQEPADQRGIDSREFREIADLPIGMPGGMAQQGKDQDHQ